MLPQAVNAPAPAGCECPHLPAETAPCVDPPPGWANSGMRRQAEDIGCSCRHRHCCPAAVTTTAAACRCCQSFSTFLQDDSPRKRHATMNHVHTCAGRWMGRQ